MAANKRKILENARKLVQKGAKDKALKEYQKLLQLDPKDAKLRLEIGDAHRRWGQVEEAIETYSWVATQYMRDGFDARAVAVYKQIVNLDPECFDAYLPLSELYERMGLMGEALSTLQTAADGLNHRGEKRKALDLLRKMATIDPSNTTSRVKVAELLRQEGLAPEAIVEYEEVASELERQGDLEAACRIHHAILEIDNKHTAACVGLARNLLAGRNAAQAEEPARRALELGRDDPDSYELLADVLRALGKDSELSEVYKSLADLYRRRGDEDRARDIVQRYVSPESFAMEADDDRESADVGLQPDASDFGDEQLLADGFGDDELELIDDEELDSAVDLDNPIESPPTGPRELVLDAEDGQARPAPSVDVVPQDADPEQLLAEASVYLRYGKQDRAIAHLEAVLRIEPEHRAALEKLGEACAESGDSARAVEAWLTAAKRAEEDGDEESRSLLRERIAVLDPNAAASLGGKPPSSEPAPPHAGEPDTEEIEIELDLDDDDPVPDPPDSEGVLSPAAQPPIEGDGPDLSGSLSTTTSQQISDDLEEADFYVQQGLMDEAGAIYQRVLSIAPNHPTALVRLGEVAAARGADPNSTASGRSSAPAGSSASMEMGAALDPLLAESADRDLAGGKVDELLESSVDALVSNAPLDLGDGRLPTETGTPAEALPRESEVTLDFDENDIPDDLDDGLADEPEPESGADLANEEPLVFDTDPGIEPELPAVEPSPEPPVALRLDEAGAGVDLVSEIGGFDDETPPESEDGDDSFDLAAELSGALDDSQSGSTGSGGIDDGFSAVLHAFKKGVSETLAEGDHQAHYDLGIAYKEMGLPQDAMGEFRTAMSSGERRLECLHLIGLCAIDAGEPGAAVVHLEQLLAARDIPDDAALAAQYDIGRAYAVLGETSRARLAFESVRALDPHFQDVQGELARLVVPPSPASVVPEPEDDPFESFAEFLDAEAGAEVDDSDEPEPEAKKGVDADTREDPVAEPDATPEDGDDVVTSEFPVDELDMDEVFDDPSTDDARGQEKTSSGARRRKKKISFV